MKPVQLLGLVFLIAPLGLVAQGYIVTVPPSFGVAGAGPMGAAGQAQAHPRTVPAVNSCPVALQAKHGTDGRMMKTRKSHPEGLGQALHLTFTSPDTRTLASATINVHGWAAAHFQPAAGNHARAVRTVQVPLTPESGRTAHAQIWVPGLTAVESIDLLSASFADGSTWSAAVGTTCRITPDLLMLISTP